MRCDLIFRAHQALGVYKALLEDWGDEVTQAGMVRGDHRVLPALKASKAIQDYRECLATKVREEVRGYKVKQGRLVKMDHREMMDILDLLEFLENW